MKILKCMKRILAVVLVLALFLQRSSMTITYAVEGEEKEYIASMELFVAGSLKEAVAKCQSAGFECYPVNLNDGNDADACVIGYLTTDDPARAITDISVLEMNNGYVMYDYAKILESEMENLGKITSPFMTSIAEYRENLLSGSPAAEEARTILNVFMLPDQGNIGLGDYLASENCSETYIKKIIAQANSGVTYALFSCIAAGVADFGTENWAQRIYHSEMQEKILSSEYAKQLDRGYQSYAKDLTSVLQDFYAGFSAAKTYVDTYGMKAIAKGAEVTEDYEVPEETLQKIEEGEALEDKDSHSLYLITYEILNQYRYNDEMLLGDYILSLGTLTYSTDADYRKVYPLLDALSFGQFGVLRITGVPQIALCLLNDASMTAEAAACVAGIREDVLSYTGGSTSSLSVFAGTDQALYQGQVALTSDANRETRASGEYSQLTQVNVTDEYLDKILSAAYVASSMIGIGVFVATVAANGYAIATMGFTAWLGASVSAWTVCFNAALGVGCGIMGSICGFLGCVVIAMSYIIFAVILLVLLVMFICWIVDKLSPEEDTISYQLSDIPLEVFDYRDGNYLKYDGVRLHGTSYTADLNCNEGRRFVALYTTTNTNAGEPLTVSDIQETFKLQKNNTSVPLGYEAVHYFGSKEAANLNAYSEDNEAAKLYLSFFRTEATEINEGAETDTAEEEEYISFLKVSTEETQAAAKDALKKEGYTVIDYNLTAFMSEEDGGYSYLGYKTTKNPEAAVTDIRIAASCSNEEFGFGKSNYVLAGTTSCGSSVYFSKSKLAGTPVFANLEILSKRSDAKAGYEPVNLFSGGPAYNLNEGREPEDPNAVAYEDWGKQAAYIYFLPSVTYTEGTLYLGGLNFFTGINTNDSKGNEVKLFAESEGYTLFSADFTKDFKSYMLISSDTRTVRSPSEPVETYLGYTTTYNPYRAIYDIRSYTAIPGVSALNSTTGSYSQERGAYAVCDVFFMSSGDNNNASADIEDYFRGVSMTHSYIGIQNYRYGIGAHYENPNSPKEDFEDYGFKYSKCRLKNLYVTGAAEGKAPLTPADLQISTDLKDHETIVAQGFRSVQDVRTPNREEAHNLAFDSDHPVCLYVKGTAHEEKYISSIYVASWNLDKYKKDQKITELSDDQEDLLRETAMHYCASVLMSACEDEIILRNLAESYGNSWEKDSYNEPSNAAYIGVTRTDDISKAIRSVIKFRPAAGEKAEQTITVYGTTYTRAGDTPIHDAGGNYYLYYSTNNGCAPSEPITSLSFNDIPIISDAATALTATVTDIQEIKVNGVVKREGRTAELKGYTNETNYIHASFETNKTYISDIYVGSGNSMKAAMVDLLDMGCNMMIGLDMNKDASGKYVCLGYDRYDATDDGGAYAVRDLLFTVDEDAKEKIIVDGVTYIRARDRYIMENDTKHAVSFNEGTNGRKIYLYYTSEETEKAQSPVMKLAATMCDYVPDNKGRYVWESVLTTDGMRCNLNDGVFCAKDGVSYDNRIYLFANREANEIKEGAAIIGGTTMSSMQYGKLVCE